MNRSCMRIIIFFIIFFGLFIGSIDGDIGKVSGIEEKGTNDGSNKYYYGREANLVEAELYSYNYPVDFGPSKNEKGEPLLPMVHFDISNPHIGNVIMFEGQQDSQMGEIVINIIDSDLNFDSQKIQDIMNESTVIHFDSELLLVTISIPDFYSVNSDSDSNSESESQSQSQSFLSGSSPRAGKMSFVTVIFIIPALLLTVFYSLSRKVSPNLNALSAIFSFCITIGIIAIFFQVFVLMPSSPFITPTLGSNDLYARNRDLLDRNASIIINIHISIPPNFLISQSSISKNLYNGELIAPCMDSIDNDDDGYEDYPYDAGCTSPQKESEVDSTTTIVIPIKVDSGDKIGLVDNWPFGAGIPFSRGFLHLSNNETGFDSKTILCVGLNQGFVPIQIFVKSFWPDNSVNWIWVDIVGDPYDEYSLHVFDSMEDNVPIWNQVFYDSTFFNCSGKNSTFCSSGMVVNNDDNIIVIDTGQLTVEWNKFYGSPVKITENTSNSTYTGSGHGIWAIDRHGRFAFLGDNNSDISPLEWSIERNGDLRTTIRVYGEYKIPINDTFSESVAACYVYFTLYRGFAHIFITHTFVFTRDTTCKCPSGCESEEGFCDDGYPNIPGRGIIWFRDYGITLPWKSSNDIDVLFGIREEGNNCFNNDSVVKTDDNISFLANSMDEIWILQSEIPHLFKNSSDYQIGTSTWNFNCSGYVDGWSIMKDSTNQKAVVVAIKDFAQTFPKEINFQSDGISGILWSSRGGLDLDPRPSTLAERVLGEEWICALHLPTNSIDTQVSWDTYMSNFENEATRPFSMLGSSRTHDLFFSYPDGSHVNMAEAEVRQFLQRPIAVPELDYLNSVDGILWKMEKESTFQKDPYPFSEESFGNLTESYNIYMDTWHNFSSTLFPYNGWYHYGIPNSFTYQRIKESHLTQCPMLSNLVGEWFADGIRTLTGTIYSVSKNYWTPYFFTGKRIDWERAYTISQTHADFMMSKSINSRYGRMGWQRYATMETPIPWWATIQGGNANNPYVDELRIPWVFFDALWAMDSAQKLKNWVSNTDIENNIPAVMWDPYMSLGYLFNFYRVLNERWYLDQAIQLASRIIDPTNVIGFSDKHFSSCSFDSDSSCYNTPGYKTYRKYFTIMEFFEYIEDEDIPDGLCVWNTSILFTKDVLKQTVLIAGEQHWFSESISAYVNYYRNLYPVYIGFRAMNGTRPMDYNALFHILQLYSKQIQHELVESPIQTRTINSDIIKTPFSTFSMMTLPQVLYYIRRKPSSIPLVDQYISAVAFNLYPSMTTHIRRNSSNGFESLIFVTRVSLVNDPSPGSCSLLYDDGTKTPLDWAEGYHEFLDYHLIPTGGYYAFTVPSNSSVSDLMIRCEKWTRYMVVTYNIDGIVLDISNGSWLGNLPLDTTYYGFAAANNAQYYFQVDEVTCPTDDVLLFRKNEPFEKTYPHFEIYDASGINRTDSIYLVDGGINWLRSGLYGINLSTLAPGSRYGLWYLKFPSVPTYIRFESCNIIPAVSLSKKSYFKLGRIDYALPLVQNDLPSSDGGFINGTFGLGYQLKRQYTGNAIPLIGTNFVNVSGMTDWPFTNGTIEFWYRPDWSTDLKPEYPGWTRSFLKLPPVDFGYLNRYSFYLWHRADFKTWVTTSFQDDGINVYDYFPSVTFSFNENQWYHMVTTWQHVREGISGELEYCQENIHNDCKFLVEIFINGSLMRRSFRYSTKFNDIGPLENLQLDLMNWSGAIDEVRISKGLCFHDNFNPPDLPYCPATEECMNTPSCETVLLFHFENSTTDETGKIKLSH